MGKKISTYDVLASSLLSLDDKFIGTQSSTGETYNFSIAELKAFLTVLTAKEVTLSNASSYQDNDFLDVTQVYGFYAGSEGLTSGLIDSFDADTGTVTFNSAWGTLTGKFIFVIIP